MPELAGRLGQNRLHQPARLHAARRALRRPRRGIGHHCQRAPPHRLRLVEQRQDAAGRGRVVHRLIRAVVDDDEHVGGEDAAILREAQLQSTGWLGRARPMKCSSSRVMRSITGAPAFFASSAGTTRISARGHLAAEAAAGVLADDDDVLGVHAEPARHGRHRLRRALAGAVHVELAVLPVGHRRAGLERLVAVVRRDEGLVEHQRRVLEAGVEIAVGPLSGAVPIGSLPSA